MSETESDIAEIFFSASSNDASFTSVPSLAETLMSQFSDGSRNFNVVHINAQSVPAHFPDMLASFSCENIHAILISESWLKPCLPSCSYALPGFRLIRNDRISGGGGGVAIYLRTHIEYTIISLSAQPPPPNAGEHLFLEVELNHRKVLLGVYYSPSSHLDFFSSFEGILETLVPSYNHCIIMGDFNTCLLKSNSRSSSFLSVTESCNLSILPLNATHTFPNCTPSLLDLILISSRDHVAKHGQCSADAFSYHDLLFLSYKIRPPKAKSRILLQRNFGGIDLDNLREDASGIDWDPLFACDDCDEKVKLLTTLLTELYDKHAPIRPVRLKHLPSPWLTEELKILLSKKAASKARFKRIPTVENRNNYMRIRNRCNRMCRDAQRQHIHTSVENGDPVKVWKFLRTLGIGKTRHVIPPSDVNLNALNLHFSTSSNFDVTVKSNTMNSLSNLPTPDFSPFIFNHLTACGVKKSILSITSNAVGADNLSRNMILPILDEILPVITHIMNYSLSNGTFPFAWKDAQITPLPKKPNPKSFSEYRPISILSFLSKVLERLIHAQLSEFLYENNLLNPFQSGFRPGHSTTTALVNITDDIRLGMERGMLTVLALLDFSNAFNTVDIDILLATLGSLNTSPSVVDWFRSYLSGRRQRVRIEDNFSSWCDTCVGVPQGGVLSPLLFAIYINSVSNHLISSYHLYADDLQLYTQAPVEELPLACTKVNNDLLSITNWSKSYGLQINPTKTQVIIVGAPRRLATVDWTRIPPISIDGVQIPVSDKVRNLGIFVDRHMSWDAQIKETCRKIYAAAGSLRRLRNFLPTATKTALAQSLLLPILDYADVSYLDLTEAQLNKLERLQNFCLRFIFGLRKYDHVSEFRAKLKWLPIRLRRNAHILSLLYTVLFNPSSPSYLKRRFEFIRDTHTISLRSTDNMQLMMPVHSTRFYDHSFTVQAIRLWNALPVRIRHAETLNSFKRLIKEHF